MVWVPLLPAAHRHYRQKQYEVAQDAQPPAAHHPLGARQHDKEAGRESPRIREAAVSLASTIANGGIMRLFGTIFTHHHHHHQHPSKIPLALLLSRCCQAAFLMATAMASCLPIRRTPIAPKQQK